MSLLSELDDDGKLKRKYFNKRVNARKDGLECELSFTEYCILLKQAGLKSSDLGFSGNGYVLARYNDSGNYTFTNCRFITQKEKAKEKVVSRKASNASHDNIVKYNLSSGKQIHNYHFCIDCGKRISYRHKRCNDCNTNYIQSISHCPSKEELLTEILSSKPLTSIAKQYKVSDNTVRKWCKKFQIPYTAKQRKTLM